MEALFFFILLWTSWQIVPLVSSFNFSQAAWIYDCLLSSDKQHCQHPYLSFTPRKAGGAIHFFFSCFSFSPPWKMAFFKVNEHLEPQHLFSLDFFLFLCAREMCLAVATQQCSCQTRTHTWTHTHALSHTRALTSPTSLLDSSLRKCRHVLMWVGWTLLATRYRYPAQMGGTGLISLNRDVMQRLSLTLGTVRSLFSRHHPSCRCSRDRWTFSSSCCRGPEVPADADPTGPSGTGLDSALRHAVRHTPSDTPISNWIIDRSTFHYFFRFVAFIK